uniref:Reverse transcriptase domain-containing protein n=1 Tax=Pygocentrus nattereri TaxID=42514 RepID=A0A3B4EBS9_PYGNA
MPPSQESGPEASGVSSSISLVEVTEVVVKLFSCKAPGVDEIRPEMLKVLDIVGLSWLMRLCNIAWTSRTVPLDWQTRVVVPIFKKGDRRVCANYWGITLLSLPGKVYAKVLERSLRPIVEPQTEEEQCRFRPSHGTMDQHFTLSRIVVGAWKFANPVYMCFVDLEKTYDRVPRDILWEVLREYAVPGLLLRAIRSLYSQSQSCVHILNIKSDPFSVSAGHGCALSPLLFVIFMDRVSRRSQGLEGIMCGSQSVVSLLFADDVVLLAESHGCLQRSLEQFAAECEAVGMRISTSKSESMVLAQKRMACS